MSAYKGIKINKTVKDSPDLNPMFKTSKISEILSRPSSIDPFSNLANRSSYMRFFKDNQAEDQDKVKDELLKVKKELNKKNKELTELKIEFQRLEEDNNKNLKVIQDILNEFGKDIGENILAELTNNNTEKNIDDLNENFNESPGNNDQMQKLEDDEKRMSFIPDINRDSNLKPKHENLKLNWKSYIRLRELLVINSLKKQLGSFKAMIKQKDEEIETLKSNLKCAKYSKLEFNYNKNLKSFIKTKKDYENVKKIQTDTTDKLIKEKEENDKLYSSLNRYKNQNDEMKIRVKIIEDENKELLMRNKALEEKLNFMKNFSNPPSHYSKVSLRQKENLILSLKSELQVSAEKYKTERQRLERRVYFLDKDFKKVKEILEIKNEEKKDIEKNVNNLKEESKKFINNLQWMIRIEKELFLSEKKQLNEYIQTLKILIEKANKEHDLQIEIPEFKLILPTSTCLQEINQHKLLKDLEKKYQETEKKLNISLNNQESIQLMSQLELPKQEDQNNMDLQFKVNNDNPTEVEKRENDDNNMDINKDLPDFKIEPIKGKESLMLTALNRNKLIEDNFLKDTDHIENPCLSAENKEKKHEEIDNNKINDPLEKEDLIQKPVDSNKLNVKDENNNPNTSVMNTSKLRLKNIIHCVVDAVSSCRNSKNFDSNHNRLKVPMGFELLNDLNSNMIFNEDLKREINEISNNAAYPIDNKVKEDNLDDHDKIKSEEEYFHGDKEADSDDTMKNDSVKEKLDDINEKEVIKHEKTTKIQFNEEKNEVVFHEKEKGNNYVNDEEKSALSYRKDTKENLEKIELNFSKVSNKSSKPIPKKKRSSCQEIRCNYVIKILESEEQVIDVFKPYYIVNEDKEEKRTISRNDSKSKSQIIKTQTMKKMNTIEKIFTEGIQRNCEFEDFLNDPRILELYNDEI